MKLDHVLSELLRADRRPILPLNRRKVQGYERAPYGAGLGVGRVVGGGIAQMPAFSLFRM